VAKKRKPETRWKRVVAYTLTPELIDMVKEAARDAKMSRSAFVRMALTAYLLNP